MHNIFCLNHFENADINFGEHANDDEMQKTKTPVTLLNEWAMRKGNGKPEKMVVTYKLVALDGYSHKPSFTFMCLVDNKRGRLIY